MLIFQSCGFSIAIPAYVQNCQRQGRLFRQRRYLIVRQCTCTRRITTCAVIPSGTILFRRRSMLAHKVNVWTHGRYAFVGNTTWTAKLPSTWQPMMPHQQVMAVELRSTDQEYIKIAHNFETSLGSKRQIIRVCFRFDYVIDHSFCPIINSMQYLFGAMLATTWLYIPMVEWLHVFCVHYNDYCSQFFFQDWKNPKS